LNLPLNEYYPHQILLMIQNYIAVTLRNLSRNKLFATLNIVGLAFGLTGFFLLGLYLFDELTFDGYHARVEQIYRIIEHKKTKNEGLAIAGTSYRLAAESKQSMGEIENTARLARFGRSNLMNPDRPDYRVHEVLTIADNGLMEIFDFEAVQGDPKTALKEPNTIVVTEEIAQRYFGNSHVLGKILRMDFQESPLRITAVLKNHPRNSSFDFPLLISEATLQMDTNFQREVSQDWSSNDFLTFALLSEKADPMLVASKMTKLVYDHFKPEEGTSIAYNLQALKDMHLYSGHIVRGALNSNVATMGSDSLFYLKVFASVALFVLLLACINYMNLTTAKASNRSKEIGIRKASGARRGQLLGQFMFESAFLCVFAFVLAVFLVNLLLPFFNAFTEKQLSLDFTTDRRIWFGALGAVLATGLLSGSYPAFVLSRFSPLLLLKNLKTKGKSDWALRKVLVVFQFSVSVLMIVATIVLYNQVQYIHNKDLGFNKDLLAVVDINSGTVRRGSETVQAEFSKIPGVKNVSVTSRVPGEWKSIPTVKIRAEGNRDDFKVAYLLGVDEDFAKTFEVELLQGQFFSGAGDTSSILLNETAAKMMGIGEATGQMVEIPERAFDGSFAPLRNNVVFRARVMGIVKDFHFQTLREKIAPLVLAYQDNPVQNIDYFTSRIEAGDIPGTLKKMEAVLLAIDPDHPLEYHFLDEQLALFYIEDAQRQTMLVWAALAAIFIACMGLFGLAAYAAEQRVKEIGIRKVLGASIAGITGLLAKDFLKLVCLGILIAAPIAYYFMTKWLEDFAYRIDIQWWMFAVAALGAVSIAFLTVAFQSVRAALANPVKSLRSE